MVRLLLLVISLSAFSVSADEWRKQPLSRIDREYMEQQVDAIDNLARRYFGRQITGNKNNDLYVIQRLLDQNIVTSSDVTNLQAMGVVLGKLLEAEENLNWVIYIDKYGRSRTLQVSGFDKEFIFPVTQISRKVEVGLKVDVSEVYQKLRQSITDIRNKPPF